LRLLLKKEATTPPKTKERFYFRILTRKETEVELPASSDSFPDKLTHQLTVVQHRTDELSNPREDQPIVQQLTQLSS
ncbi:MAG: hypothetical protein ACYTXE_43270, partial [Nostoc sp.]